MRAATVIVGAIAVSSCLVALALVLTSGGDSSSTAATSSPAGRAPGPSTNGGAAAPTARQPSGPIQCNVEVTVEGASCLLGKSVLASFREGGLAAGTLTAADPQTGEEATFECAGEAPTICTSGGVTVYLAPTES
jgi:hypothetical protein